MTGEDSTDDAGMARRKRPRVLVIAEAANPEWVSVPLVGWSHAMALRAVADVHVVTQVRNRDAFLRAGLVEDRDFTAIDSERLARPMWRVGQMLARGEGQGWTIQQAISRIAYPYFERLIWRQFGDRIRAGSYDIVHRITPLSPVQPSPLVARCRRAGVPFVLGPINGGVPWPPGFEAEMRREKEWLSRLRGAYRLLPGRRATLRASAILAGSHRTAAEIPARHRARVIYMPENAIDPVRFSAQATHARGPLRACFIGRLVPLKGVDMLLEAAMPLLADGRMTLDLIGDGPMRDALQAQAAQVTGAVRFHGWVPHTEVQHLAATCGVLAFPSIREFGGGVVLEAMALGLAPIVIDYAGPGELVTDTTGFKVPLGSRAEIVTRLRSVLQTCAGDPESVARIGAAARARALHLFTWPQKARQMAEVYAWVLGDRPDCPRFFD